jgi:hypothetical protein
MNIIKTDIVTAGYDVFWQDVSPALTDTAQKPVLVIVAGCAANSPEDLQLQKMLEACKLNSSRYNIVRLDDEQQISWHQLREKVNPKIIFLIGVLPAQLGISALFQFNRQNNFNDRIWLPTLSLSELEKNQEIKKQLWQNGMKPLFIDSGVI